MTVENGTNEVRPTETDPVKAARNSKIRIALASMIACIGSMSIGFNGAYASPAIPNLNRHRNPFHVTREQQSWFVSIAFVTAIPGAFLTGIFIDKLGRKLGLMFAAIPFVTGWVLISGAYSPYMLYIARLISGFSAALILSVVSVYVAEIAPAHIRGLLMSLHEVFVNLGILAIYTFGAYVRWNWLAIVCVVPPVLLSSLMVPMPESPRWLVMKGRIEEAKEVVQWLCGGSSATVADDIARIQSGLKDAATKVPWSDYFRAPLLKCLVVSQLLFVLQEFSGINIVRTYTVTIFQSAGSHMNPYTQTIIVGAMMLAGSILCTFVIDRLPRRLLLMGSATVMALSMASMGTFFLILEKDKHFALHNLSWLPLLSLVVMVFSYTLGCGPLPYVITSELFSTRTRGRACSLGIATLCLCGFFTTKFFVNVRLIIGDYGTFWSCGGICLLGAIFTFFFVPETKGKSLEQLEKELQ